MLESSQAQIPLPDAAAAQHQAVVAAATTYSPVGQALGAPTNSPAEPVTAGLPVGPGPGPEGLTTPPDAQGSLVGRLSALYRAYPNEDVRRALQAAQLQDPFMTAAATAAPQIGGAVQRGQGPRPQTEPVIPDNSNDPMMVPPPRAPDLGAGWTQEDAQELRRRNRKYKGNGDITTKQTPGGWVYVYPNGREIDAPSTRAKTA